MKSVAIIGCGWLGLPLANALVKHKYKVSGSVTSLEKKTVLTQKGIEAYCVLLQPNSIKGPISELLASKDAIIITIPPRIRIEGVGSYLLKMKGLLSEILKAGISKVIFVSSTAVYGSVNGSITENTAPKPSSEAAKEMLAVEQLFNSESSLQTTIIRMGGLIGPNRHPIVQLSAKKEVNNGNWPVNLIHLVDCIHLITHILQTNLWNTVINGVYPAHDTKKEYYTAQAKNRNLPIPNFKENPNETGKIVHCSNKELLDSFSFSTPI